MKTVKITALFAALALTGCAKTSFQPYACELDGVIYCSPGVVVEKTIDGEKSSFKMDTTAFNWWSWFKNATNQTLDRLTGVASKTTATIK